MLNTPVLFIIFNRLDTVKKVFETIKNQKPKQLFVFCDGPRNNIPNENEKCKLTQQYIIKNITWECDLKTLFLEDNNGPGLGVVKGINWFFENVEEGINLEHDCLPHSDFFGYCHELLNHFRDNEKIMFISGNVFTDRFHKNETSYGFNALSHIWGWATWKRVWEKYEYNLSISDKELVKLMRENSYFNSNVLVRHLRYVGYLYRNKKVNTWDMQLLCSIWKNKGLSVFPKNNLVSNIGFGNEAVHCKDPEHPTANLPVFPILPIVHNSNLVLDFDCDLDYYNKYLKRSLLRYIINIIGTFVR